MERTRTTSHQSKKSNGLSFPVLNGRAETGMRPFGGQADDDRAMLDRLNSDLKHARNENQQLVDALRSLHSQFNSLQMHADKQSELLMSGGEELQEAKQQLNSLQRELERTQKVQARMQERGDNSKDLSEIEKSNAALRLRLQELEQYIDGHKGNWTESDRKLRDYHDALAGMEQEIKNWKGTAEEHERNNAELAVKIVSLERRCAELDGRRAERESAYEDLRATFDVRNMEIEQLNLNVSRMQKELMNLVKNGPERMATSASGDREAAKEEKEAVVLPVNGAREQGTGNGKEAKPWWYAEENEDVARWTAGAQPELKKSNKDVDKNALPERFFVIPIGGKGKDTHFPLNKKIMTIGRSRDNDIPVVSGCVSRIHARIIQTDSRVIIEDLGSKNGILVNSRPKRFQQLKHGDTFTIGFREFELFDTGAGNQVRPATPAG